MTYAAKPPTVEANIPFAVAFFQYMPTRTGKYQAAARAARAKLIMYWVRVEGFRAINVATREMPNTNAVSYTHLPTQVANGGKVAQLHQFHPMVPPLFNIEKNDI